MPRLDINDIPIVVNDGDDWEQFEKRVMGEIERNRKKREYHSYRHQSKKYYHQFEDD